MGRTSTHEDSFVEKNNLYCWTCFITTIYTVVLFNYNYSHTLKLGFGNTTIVAATATSTTNPQNTPQNRDFFFVIPKGLEI